PPGRWAEKSEKRFAGTAGRGRSVGMSNEQHSPGPFRIRLAGPFAIAGAIALFTGGCAALEEDVSGIARDTRDNVSSRIDARTASAENRVDQERQEARERVTDPVDRTLNEADANLDRSIDRALGGGN